MSLCLPWLARPIQIQQSRFLEQAVLSIMAEIWAARSWGEIQATTTLVLAWCIPTQLMVPLHGGVCPERVVWPCPYPDRLYLQPPLRS